MDMNIPAWAKGPAAFSVERESSRGFTLLELIIALSVSVMIASVLYFSLKTALESWAVSQDQLILQQVSSRIMEELVEGPLGGNGLRDVLEVVDCSPVMAVTVMPWTDDTHDVSSGISVYTLNKHIKPGTNAPIAEALLPEANEYKVVPVTLIEEGKSEDYPRAGLDISLPAGSRLRFTYYPDYKNDVDVLTTFRYDPEEQGIFVEDEDGTRELYANPFGVKITEFRMRFFDSGNNELEADGDDVSAVTGIEVTFRARSVNGTERETITFVSLRNAPMHSGIVPVKEGMRFAIPDSKEIRALSLCNLSGIDNGDSIILEARSEHSRTWRLKVQFSKLSSAGKPIIESYTVEYPSGNKVFSERPRIPAEFGLNLLNLGPNGLYDYGFNDIDGEILLTEEVTLEVDKMDIGGAAIFVRP